MTTEAEKIALYIEANADNAAPDKDREWGDENVLI
ncbi:Uncharacterised protein [Candidatus Venteria ishoeyi]|uniref:Uncharacterized protein n=1 Tax=Candidatus Venteria ishoeyi TaxID=1899563 RepID=A0A1H6F7C2_9GAMM|nr:Uncharacterised protein [Candidatus Venteria ishoeyi]